MVPLWFGRWADALIDVLALRPDEEVLDVACGTGVTIRITQDGPVRRMRAGVCFPQFNRRQIGPCTRHWARSAVRASAKYYRLARRSWWSKSSWSEAGMDTDFFRHRICRRRSIARSRRRYK